jgi:hypothetical protein
MGLVLAGSAGCDLVLPLHHESPAPDDGGVADGNGPGDTGQGDAISTAPPRCPADAIFCEDFEGAVAGWDGVDQFAGGSCAVTNARAHAGTKSLRAFAPFHNTAPNNESSCTYNHLLPQLETGTLAIRAFVYVVGPARSGSWALLSAHKSLASGCSPGDMKGDFHDDQWGFFYCPASACHGSGTSIEHVPLDRWFCVEWDITLGAPGHVSIFVDGSSTPVLDNPSAQLGDHAPFCGYPDLDFGVPENISSSDVEVFWDDIAVATHPIGCGP